MVCEWMSFASRNEGRCGWVKFRCAELRRSAYPGASEMVLPRGPAVRLRGRAQDGMGCFGTAEVVPSVLPGFNEGREYWLSGDRTGLGCRRVVEGLSQALKRGGFLGWLVPRLKSGPISGTRTMDGWGEPGLAQDGRCGWAGVARLNGKGKGDGNARRTRRGPLRTRRGPRRTRRGPRRTRRGPLRTRGGAGGVIFSLASA
jgi:hypothetical protein